MIVTGRNEKMRPEIVQNFKNLKIPMPNFGLYLFTGGNVGISAYKIKVIEDSIINNQWDEVHFFEDRKDWLDNAESEILKKFPYIVFKKHLIVKK